MRSTRGLACSAGRWEKFNRATSIPASINRRNISSLSLAGPIVATIFVRLLGRAIVRIVTEPGRNHKSEELHEEESPGGRVELSGHDQRNFSFCAYRIGRKIVS